MSVLIRMEGGDNWPILRGGCCVRTTDCDQGCGAGTQISGSDSRHL